MGRKNKSKISDRGQWLNNRNTVRAFYDEMIKYGDRIDELKAELRNAKKKIKSLKAEIQEQDMDDGLPSIMLHGSGMIIRK